MLIITGIPEKILEPSINVVLDIANYLGIDISADDIDAAHPLPSKKLVVKFINRRRKEEFLKLYINCIKEKRKITTADLRYTGPAQHVYISEHLTPKLEKIL